ncbi:PKD domain-containing protein [Cellulophaga sp. Hel_I_12]|uniref:PKD domain-containing protein n=1 Tax=Cellulophaga sp. Hel_I_12 TaxID=1249972 RepID=UPI000691C748|nr:PKD domain-containing protein [Cellulophaga sp. Hel_I_12]
MKLLLKKAKLISIFILAISFLGCDDEESQLPAVSAAFTYTINENTGTVTFINISEDARTYLWTFGDGRTSTEINPIKTFANGTFTITLKAMGISGASNTSEDTITINIPDKISLPVTFDGPNVAYTIATFNGTSFEILDNPDASGTNDKASKVGAITNIGAAFEGINFDVGTQIDLATEKTITMNFWSDVPVPVLMKLEEGTAADIEVTANHGGTGWETINFNFSSSAKYIRLTLFVDGPGTSAGTFYIDDIAQIVTPIVENGCATTPIAATALPLNFEACETFLSSENFGDGISSKLAPNPSKSGINNSDFVLQVDKPAGSSFFAGVQNTFENNFDLTTTNTFKVKVYSTKANVVLRFELAVNPQTVPVTGNPAPVFRTVANANVWTEVSFTFTNLPGAPTAYNQLVIKPDNNETDSAITADGTYYFDDLTLSAPATGGGGALVACDGGVLVNNFETADNSIFNNFGGGVGTIINNSDTSVNSSAKLGQYVKNAGEPFGGITIALGSTIDLDNGTFSIDVNSQSVRQLLFKLEGLNQELILPTSGTGWETLSYDFSGLTGGVTGITLIMDNGVQGDGSAAWTIQFDNIRLCDNGGSGGGGALVACDGGVLVNNFETADNSIFNNFGGGLGTIIDNSDTSVNSSAKLGQYVKNAGEPFGGITIALASTIDLDKGTFSIDVNSQSVRQLLFKLEGLNQELILPTSGTGWETLSYNFSSFTGAVTGITLIMDNGVQGDGSAAWTIQFDNIRLCDNGGSGGGGSSCTPPPAGQFITDGGFEQNAGCWELIQIQAGTSSTISTTVNNGGSNSARIKTAQAGNPGIKQTRFGIGAILPNTAYIVKFDIRSDANDPVANGSILNAATFSESAEGSGIGAVRHNLVSGDANIPSTWTTRTITFTTSGNVDGGLSLLIELIGGGPTTTGTVFIDNVSLVAQ